MTDEGRRQDGAPERRDEEVEPQRPTDTEPEASQESSREASYTHIGPLPDPITLRAYGQIMPGLPERIVSGMEGETDHRQNLETRGQTIGALLAGGGLVGGVAAILFGHDLAGVAIVASGVGPLVYAFVRSR